MWLLWNKLKTRTTDLNIVLREEQVKSGGAGEGVGGVEFQQEADEKWAEV